MGSNHTEELTVSIFNSIGILCKTASLTHDEQIIHIGDLDSGIYLVELKSSAVNARRRLIIQREY